MTGVMFKMIRNFMVSGSTENNRGKTRHLRCYQLFLSSRAPHDCTETAYLNACHSHMLGLSILGHVAHLHFSRAAGNASIRSRYIHGKPDQSTTTVARHETDPVFLASDTFLVGGDFDATVLAASGPRVDRRIILLMLPRSRAGYFGIGFRHRAKHKSGLYVGTRLGYEDSEGYY
ncbi:hypothetical protein DBV15_05015 [Temnothorax longispinosus]|uniref:Uncharacterized protein n=1 Tax=Temnothorax longispinosus TaxID=300112 RepID=A0A4S2KIJ7_9HYME|nr:hypothetical protein DBV15_05015 [Temnothorax longispinosus]